jgi:hypothetical protein
MFRYICIILREFQSCTSLKLRSFYFIKIWLKITKLKYLCSCVFYAFAGIGIQSQ